MVVYKWVIKKGNEYLPIVNNGALKVATGIKLSNYKKGNTIKGFVRPKEIKHCRDFHREGFHFWVKHNDRLFSRYQKCMNTLAKKQINCILKCYVRDKDIIKKNDERLIASKFRILGEF